ncbi:MAG: molybdenum cofactor biosynthesis protein MoaE [Acidimicrobiia bacterium]|nr:molybdenum cofactor biosynthesis protein MoaE [Acidimicrobiia bacterium]
MNSTSQPDSVRISVEIVSDDIDVAALVDEVADHRAGAIDLFVGTVRDHSEGRESVTHLEYEAYEEEVEDVIREIAIEASENWDLIAISIRHRTGTLRLGGIAVAVAVSAGHRTEVFDACRYLIDELKARAPIWKKEHWAEGAEWVLGP